MKSSLIKAKMAPFCLAKLDVEIQCFSLNMCECVVQLWYNTFIKVLYVRVLGP